jgi:hypothetical protein
LSADGQKAYALVDTELQSFNLSTGEIISLQPIAPNSLNLTLHSSSGTIASATSNGVQLIHVE